LDICVSITELLLANRPAATVPGFSLPFGQIFKSARDFENDAR
jgi:hypothetical protein